jgi:hypothetical protein
MALASFAASFAPPSWLSPLCRLIFGPPQRIIVPICEIIPVILAVIDRQNPALSGIRSYRERGMPICTILISLGIACDFGLTD